MPAQPDAASLPAGWTAPRLKQLAMLVAGGTPPTAEESFWADEDEGVPWVAISDMTRGDPIEWTTKRVTSRGIQAAHLSVAPPGTLLISMYASLGEVAETAVEACWNQAILGVQPTTSQLNQTFLKYVLISSRPSLQEQARSNTQDNLNAEQIANLRIPFPPLADQCRIADFLDAEMARLDALTARKTALAALLVEKRARVGLAAVSGELTSDGAARVESRLPWLSTLPSHWETAKLSLVARLGTGHTPDRSEPRFWEDDGGIPWLTTGDIARFRDGRCQILMDTKASISRRGLDNSAAVLHPAGTVALSRTASVGFSVIMGRDMATSQDFATWTCSTRLEARFLLLCLRAMRPDLLGRLAIGSTHKTIYMPDIQGLRIPLPPVDDQKRAVDLADEAMQDIDEAFSLINRQLPLLRERRSALITAAVSGALDIASYETSRAAA